MQITFAMKKISKTILIRKIMPRKRSMIQAMTEVKLIITMNLITFTMKINTQIMNRHSKE